MGFMETGHSSGTRFLAGHTRVGIERERIEALDVVVTLLEDYREHGLQRRQVGTIVETLSRGVFLAEFADMQGEAYASLTVSEADLLVLHHHPALKVV